MKTRTASATEFKAKCLALLDEVDETGGTITVTKRGRPVAKLQPVKARKWKYPLGALVGKGEIVGDIVNTDLWGVFRKK